MFLVRGLVCDWEAKLTPGTWRSSYAEAASSAEACGIGKRLSQQWPRAGSSWHQGPMSRLQERPISKTVLPRSRRTQELPPLSISLVPTCSRRYAALSLHASDSHRARHSGHSGSRLKGKLCRRRIAHPAGSKADRASPTATAALARTVIDWRPRAPDLVIAPGLRFRSRSGLASGRPLG